MKTIRSAAVLGAGALGLLYLQSIQKQLGEACYFLAGPERFDSLNRTEFKINSKGIRFHTRNPLLEELKPDLILIAVKNYHMDSILPLLQAASGPSTIILSVLNGISSEGILEAALPGSTVLYAAALGMDAVKIGPDLNFSVKGKILLGSKDNSETEELLRVANFLNSCDIEYQIPQDIHRELWFKWMINIGVNQVSAVCSATYGLFQKEPQLRELMNKAMLETIEVAGAEGIQLGTSDLERWYKLLETLGPDGKTSMLQDIEAGRKTELDSFAGELIRRAGKQGIPVPVNETLYSILKVKEQL
ncbi:ketopantoate reductase family protein [Oceanispirochaeta sp.]|jgi:2-dehydropantoate 2-reductase|uniref:ketopantoate reductase family protein n=1 Tax=Oceanispirochaeta sp. TaxID=2035350 RepID=UPI0026241CB8|nr:ketopantoate reductase family protein [Oceanispirochaeta sp.]MDA3955098.1 ketopantoate reductase family protein [Oceanispirochaeta sp.]